MECTFPSVGKGTGEHSTVLPPFCKTPAHHARGTNSVCCDGGHSAGPREERYMAGHRQHGLLSAEEGGGLFVLRSPHVASTRENLQGS